MERGEQGYVGAAHADGVVYGPAAPAASTGAVAVPAQHDGDDGEREQMGVLPPAHDGHDCGGGGGAAECPQVDAAHAGVTAGAFPGGRGERSGTDRGQSGNDVDGEGGGEYRSRVGDRQTERVSVEHRGPGPLWCDRWPARGRPAMRWPGGW